MADELQQILHDADLYYRQSVASLCVFLGLVILSTVLRFCSRWNTGRKTLGWDDVFIVCSLVSLIALIAIELVFARYSTLHDRSLVYNKDRENYFETIKLITNYIGDIIYQIACLLPKLSICCIFLRVLGGKTARRMSQGLIIFLIANCVAFTVPFVLMCHPIQSVWSIGYACLDVAALEIWRSIPHIVTDLIMIVLPLPTVKKLHVSRPMKVRIGVTFIAAAIGLIGCCLRLRFYIVAYNQWGSSDHVAYSVDVLFTADVKGNVFTCLEPAMYHIAANLPPLRSLMAKWHTQLQQSNAYVKVKLRLRQMWPLRSSHASAEIGRMPSQNGRAQQEPRAAPNNMRISEISDQMITRFAEDALGDLDNVRPDSRV